MSSPLVTGLAVLAVYVTDLERARRFYVDVLGFQQAGGMSPGILLQAGDVTLYLEGGREPSPAPGTTGTTTSACFYTGSVREAWARIQELGLPVVEPYTEHAPTFAMFRIADPDGNVIELVGKP